LSPALTAERGDIPYATMANAMGLSETRRAHGGASLRKRFREVFREESPQNRGATRRKW